MTVGNQVGTDSTDELLDGKGGASDPDPSVKEKQSKTQEWSRGRLVWRDERPYESGKWCVRYVFAGGSYSWWTVTVTETEEGLCVLGPTANGASGPVDVKEYPNVERMGKAQWAGPIREPWDEEGFSMRHCDGCGKVWTPGKEILVRSRLVCCANCWEQIPEGFRSAYVDAENREGQPSPEEEALRAYIIAKRR